VDKSKRYPMIAGNWKMHGSRESVAALLTGIKSAASNASSVEIVVFPPFVFLEQTQDLLSDTAIAWGGQNLCAEPAGAFTGEVSASMLLEFGCRYVLIGHSERRQLFGENDQLIAKKFDLARKVGLIPILCVGETLAEREAGRTQDIVARQLAAVLEEGLHDAIVAYEPVWAIGTGLTATPEQAQEVHAAIRSQVAARDAAIAAELRILYGGSVKSSNAAQLFAMPDVDGALVGGASLDAAEFMRICSA
jgi:triosephosphate isomerase